MTSELNIEVFVLRDQMDEEWRVSVNGRITTPMFNSKGAAEAYRDGILAGRKPEYPNDDTEPIQSQNEDFNEHNRFADGQRIEFHPGTDLWMRGCRYGYVIQELPETAVNGIRYRVRADKKVAPVIVSPSRIRRVS